VTGTDIIKAVEATIINQLTEPQPFDLRLIEESNGEDEGPVDYRLIEATSNNNVPDTQTPPEPKETQPPQEPNPTTKLNGLSDAGQPGVPMAN
jgi:hypothetical protein